MRGRLFALFSACSISGCLCRFLRAASPPPFLAAVGTAARKGGSFLKLGFKNFRPALYLCFTRRRAAILMFHASAQQKTERARRYVPRETFFIPPPFPPRSAPFRAAIRAQVLRLPFRETAKSRPISCRGLPSRSKTRAWNGGKVRL